MEVLYDFYSAVRMLVTIVAVITGQIMGAQLCYLVLLDTI